MMSDKMREEFEAWCPIPPGCVFHEGKYGFWLVWDESGEPEFSTGMGFTQTKWEAWQASRSAVVIELPAIRAEDYCPLSNVAYREECREAIEAAGLKVKP